MKIITNYTVRYLSTYIATTIIACLLLNLTSTYKFCLSENAFIFLPLLVIGVIALKGNHQIKYQAYLFLMPTLLHAIFKALFFFCLELEYAYFVIISTIFYCALFILWYIYSSSNLTVWRTLMITYLGMLFLLFVPELCSELSWDNFIINNCGTLSTYTVYATCLLLTAVFCQVRNSIICWKTAFCVICFTSFVGGFYLDPLIYHKFQYETFNGTQEENIQLSIPDTKENKHDIQVYLVSHHTDIWTYKKFEGLATQFYNHPVDFFILGIADTPSEKKSFIQYYKTLHLKMPMYFIRESKIRSSCLGARTYDDYICIIKENKLIYKGTAIPTQYAKRTLIKILRP